MPKHHKYTPETAKEILDSELAKELLEAQKENISASNPDVAIITTEISRRFDELRQKIQNAAVTRTPPTRSACVDEGEE